MSTDRKRNGKHERRIALFRLVFRIQEGFGPARDAQITTKKFSMECDTIPATRVRSQTAKILCVYKEVEILKAASTASAEAIGRQAIIAYDEKASMQEIGVIAPDLPPKPGVFSVRTGGNPWAAEYFDKG